MKKSVINWHETAKELPEPTAYEKTLDNGKVLKWKVEEPLLVIWEGRVKPSRYFPDTQDLGRSHQRANTGKLGNAQRN